MESSKENNNENKGNMSEIITYGVATAFAVALLGITLIMDKAL